MYKAILDSLKSEPIVFVDDQHIVRYMNDVAKKKFVKNPEEDLLGQSIFECHDSRSKELIMKYFEDMQAGKIDQVNVRKKGHVQGIMQAIKDDDNKVIGYIERHELIVPEQMPLKENHYQKAATYYDAMMEGLEIKDIPFYKNLIGQGKTVLEVGCGTGRIGLELAKQGNYVSGIDVSREMIAMYNEKIVADWEQIPNPIKTYTTDLSHFESAITYDYIIFPFRVFQVFFSDKIREDILEKAKSLLKPDGKIVINTFDPDLDLFQRFNEKAYIDVDTYNKCLDIQIIRHMTGKKHFEKQQIISYENTYVIKKGEQIIERFSEPMRLAYMDHEQSMKLFNSCGLSLVDSYRNWDNQPVVTEIKEELIYILKK